MRRYRMGMSPEVCVNWLSCANDMSEIHSIGEIITSFPFGNAVVDLTFTGQELWTMIEGSMRAYVWSRPVYLRLDLFFTPQGSSAGVTRQIVRSLPSSRSREPCLSPMRPIYQLALDCDPCPSVASQWILKEHTPSQRLTSSQAEATGSSTHPRSPVLP